MLLRVGDELTNDFFYGFIFDHTVNSLIFCVFINFEDNDQVLFTLFMFFRINWDEVNIISGTYFQVCQGFILIDIFSSIYKSKLVGFHLLSFANAFLNVTNHRILLAFVFKIFSGESHNSEPKVFFIVLVVNLGK